MFATLYRAIRNEILAHATAIRASWAGTETYITTDRYESR